MLQALMVQRYGQFTVEERDILGLPRHARYEAFRDLRFYASGHGPRSAAAVQVRHRAPGPRCPWRARP